MPCGLPYKANCWLIIAYIFNRGIYPCQRKGFGKKEMCKDLVLVGQGHGNKGQEYSQKGNIEREQKIILYLVFHYFPIRI